LRARTFVWISATLTSAAAFVFACTTYDEQPLVANPASADSGVRPPRADSSNEEEEEEDDDSGDPKPRPRDGGGTPDSSIIADARAPRDANGPGEAGADCVFNRNCRLGLRCYEEGTSFTCEQGARGTGRVGIDTCDSGNQCASAVCTQGPGSTFYCTDECTDATECGGMLPRCFPVTFIGRICVRNP